MKRKDLIRHLERHECILLREGSNHSVYLNPLNSKKAPVPRHKEVEDFLVIKICKELDMPNP